MSEPKISAVYYGNGQGGYRVGFCGITRIVAIEKTGNGAMVTWYQVFKGDVLTSELNGTLMEEIRYQESAP